MIPPELIQALVLQCPDWTSQNWLNVLAACSRKNWQIKPNGALQVRPAKISVILFRWQLSGYSNHREGTVIFCDQVGEGGVETIGQIKAYLSAVCFLHISVGRDDPHFRLP